MVSKYMCCAFSYVLIFLIIVLKRYLLHRKFLSYVISDKKT